MSATVDIIIKGVVIYYRKKVYGKEVWRALFPFDKDCHKVELSCKREDGKEISLGNFGRRDTRIEITTELAEKRFGSTGRFDEFVFDLTAPGRHETLEMKPGWQEKGTLLTIENIVLDVDKLLEVDTSNGGLDVVLVENNNGYSGMTETLDVPAYSIKGTIELGEKGRVIVNGGTTQIFATEPDESCTLIFNNDCNQERGTNAISDMELFYELIQEPEREDRKFFIVGRGRGNKEKIEDVEFEPQTGPVPGFLSEAGDKPCLGGKITATVATQALE